MTYSGEGRTVFGTQLEIGETQAGFSFVVHESLPETVYLQMAPQHESRLLDHMLSAVGWNLSDLPMGPHRDRLSASPIIALTCLSGSTLPYFPLCLNTSEQSTNAP